MHRNDIPIASPCGVDWNAMTAADAKKRFCDECRKHVHDLSEMTQVDASALLASAATEGLCVRYMADEHGRIRFAPEAPLPIASSRLARAGRVALAAAALTAPLSLTACMGAAVLPAPQVSPPALTATMGAVVAPPATAEPTPSSAPNGIKAPTPPAPKVAAPR